MSFRSTSPNNNDNTMNPPTNEPQQDGVSEKQSHDEEQQRSLTTSPPNQPSKDDTTAIPSPKPTPSEPTAHQPSSLEIAIARAHTMVNNNQAAQQQNIKEVASVVHIDDNIGKKATKKKKAASSNDDNDGPNTKGKYKQRIKKYNNFNIFFMLERQLLLQSRGGGINTVENPIDVSKTPYIKYKPLNLPPLPRRYNHLPLTSNWFLELISNQNKKRQHRKSHGLIPFKELAQTVAKNYREIDLETRQFIDEVSERLGWQYDEYEAREEKERKEQLDKLPQPMNATIGHTWAKKRKHDAPIAHGGKGGKKKVKSSGEGRKMGGFTFEDHSTAQHLMGMRTSTSPPYAAPRVPSSVTAGFPRIHLAEYETKRLQLEQQLIGRKATAPAVRPPTVHSMSNMPNLGNLIRMSTAAPPQQRDARAPEMDESERLKLELAQAMDDRVASERRIQDLTDKVALSRAIRASQQARQPPPAPAALPHISELTPELLKTLPTSTLALLAAGGPALTQALRAPPPPPPPPPPQPVAYRADRDNMGSLGPNATLADIEQTLLKEALLRGIVPPSSSRGGVSSAIGGAEDLYSKLAAPPARQEAATSSLSSLTLSREIDGLARQRALASMRDSSPTRAPPTSSLLESLIARNRAEQAASRATSLQTQALLHNLSKDRHELPPQGEATFDSLLSQLSSRGVSGAGAATTSQSRGVASESPMRRMSDQQLLEIASRNMSSQNMRIIDALRNGAGFAQGKTAE